VVAAWLGCVSFLFGVCQRLDVRRAGREVGHIVVGRVRHAVVVQFAYLDGDALVAFDLNRDQFLDLKMQHKSRPGCLRFADGLVAIPRSGSSVAQHFAHKAGEGGITEPETIHHIRAKRAIRDVAVARGWHAQIEARHPEGLWVADVLLTREARRVAFEVQWSAQTVDDFVARTTRYRNSDVEVVWLAKFTSRTWYDLQAAVPALPLRVDGIGTSRPHGLERVINACLRHLETAVAIPASATSILKEQCYRCDKAFGYHDRDPMWVDKAPFTADERQALGKWAATLKRVYSHTARTEYLAWHCPHCRGMQGDFYLRGQRFAVVEGRLVTDTRHVPLWHTIEAELT
jgi:hypothetical protein